MSGAAFADGANFEASINQKPYDPNQDREKVRGRITLVAMGAFAAIAIYYFYEASHATSDSWLRIEEAMKVLLPAVTSVMGTVLGFYFGSK